MPASVNFCVVQSRTLSVVQTATPVHSIDCCLSEDDEIGVVDAGRAGHDEGADAIEGGPGVATRECGLGIDLRGDDRVPRRTVDERARRRRSARFRRWPIDAVAADDERTPR